MVGLIFSDVPYRRREMSDIPTLNELNNGLPREGGVKPPNGPHAYKDVMGLVTCSIIGETDRFVWVPVLDFRDQVCFKVAYVVTEEGNWDEKIIGAVRFWMKTSLSIDTKATNVFAQIIPTLLPNNGASEAANKAHAWLETYQFIIPHCLER